MKTNAQAQDDELSGALSTALASAGITARDEVSLRQDLERHLASYMLCRLSPAAARRWKARYRILFGAEYLDGQTPVETYARALLAVLGRNLTRYPLSHKERGNETQ
jgi:hypothetical protein